MLRNNADVRQCSYIELGLPVVTPCKQMRVRMISKNNINLLLLYPFDALKYSQSLFTDTSLLQTVLFLGKETSLS